LGVGFQLLGKFARTLSSPDETLREMEAWVREYAADLSPETRIGFSEEQPTLFCQLHPAAEEMYLSLRDLDHLVASVRTSMVGPGYHIFACNMVKELGAKFGLTWTADNEEYLDETDYFFSGNAANVFKEITGWLSGLCDCFFNGVFNHKPGDMPIALCLSIGTTFEGDTAAVTPLGPRDLNWLKEVSLDGHKGRDFFAWWNAELDAEYFLGRALCRMWTDVRWRNPVSDLERETLEYVSNSLETAYKLDPNLAYPWTEWAEILDLLENTNSDLAFVRSRRPGTSTIGYRRRNVGVTLPGNWVIKVPGSLSEFESNAEGDFSAFDPTGTVWFTSYTFNKNNRDQVFAETRQKILDKSPALLEQREDYVARAEINEKNGEDEHYYLLSSSNVCRKGQAILSVVFTDPADRESAINVWKSLQPPKGKD
jgi:hypothetical protein